jgi:glycosyltransferase involved in cell wall biosynthesis
MKILHLVFSYPPDPPGGTEVYVHQLSRDLADLGVDSVVAAPASADEGYEDQGVRVRRFASTRGVLPLDVLYGGADPVAMQAFSRLLAVEQPDVLHQHAVTAACSVEAARMAKACGIPVVLTYHTPTVTCERGTLLEDGMAPCDGRLDVRRCTACRLTSLGVSRPAADVLARVPVMAGSAIGGLGRQGAVWTALRMTKLMASRHAATRELLTDVADRIVALSPWTVALLERNHVRPPRVVLVPHGVPPLTARPSGRAAAIRVAHLGRIDPVKGTALLVHALRQSPDAILTLDIYGVVQSDADGQQLSAARAAASGDDRIRFLPPLPHDLMVRRLADYDAVAIPSQWCETGPLVVLEAFAAGTPVIGSALGGIADKVTDNVDGLLVRPYDSVAAWGAAIGRCAADPALLARLRRGVRPPRASATVAREMYDLYRGLLPAGAARRQPAPVPALV